MPRPQPLPLALAARPFTVAEARRAGVSPGRLRASDLDAPHRGVRTSRAPATVRERCEAFAVRMRHPQCFTDVTAAALLGAPLPRRAENAPIHVSTSRPHRSGRVRGVVFHERSRPVRSMNLDGLTITAPEDLLWQLGMVLSRDELIAVGDYLITGTAPFDGAPPLTNLEAIAAAESRHHKSRGVAAVRAALSEVRYGALSPQETRLRLTLTRAGLPEPALNFRIELQDRTVAMCDAAYPDERIDVEFQSEAFHTGGPAFHRWLFRKAQLEELDWQVIEVSADDLRLRPQWVVTRVRRALLKAARSSRPSPLTAQ